MRSTSTRTRIALKRAPTSRETRLTRLICCVIVAVLQCDMTPTLTNRSGRVNNFFQVPAKSAYFRGVRPPGRLDVRTVFAGQEDQKIRQEGTKDTKKSK